MREDALIEIHTEELPPKTLLALGQAFCQCMKDQLKKTGFLYDDVIYFASPRRLALIIKQLAETQPDQVIERRGPTLKTAFDAQGAPTKACIAFARACAVTPAELITIKNDQGEWVGFKQSRTGKSIMEMLPDMVTQAALALPIRKRMRWGEGSTEFVRPVHAVMLLYGDKPIQARILDCEAGRTTRGHRFLAPDWMTIPHADSYESLLEVEGYVIADFAKRREKIRTLAMAAVKKQLGDQANVLISSELLDEVTGLVEWPCALVGHFDAEFLDLPKEVLISAMQDHQRYFPVIGDQGSLLPHFVVISNIESHDSERVIRGNERVLRARLSDAAFFYRQDKKVSLASRLNRLPHIIFQSKLGSLYEKSERLSKLSALMAKKLGRDTGHAERAGLLSKTDLTTDMVGEFPELQGVMGYYYALLDGESQAVAAAIKEQYMPRFAGDELPSTPLGCILAIAERIDTLVGAFGIHQMPTGDKDPYGLRRAALGLLRMLIEHTINLDLKEILEYAINVYQGRLEESSHIISELMVFIQERFRSFCQEQGISADVFASVSILGITNLFDEYERIRAVQAFKQLDEAEMLSLANKRVKNILMKYTESLDMQAIDPTLFENKTEYALAAALKSKSQAVAELAQMGNYKEILLQLAHLHQPLEDFFNEVMVMTTDKKKRENRILLLKELRALFLQVADIALLQ